MQSAWPFVINPLVMYKPSLNKALFFAIAATLISTAPIPMPVTASSVVQRCQSPDGVLIYTDKACAATGGKAVAMSAELRTRIASEAAHEQSQWLSHASLSGTSFPRADAAMSAPGLARMTRRSAAAGCARTPTQLAMDLRGSLALGDVNRLAESYHWPGMSTRQGRQTMERLQHLIGSQVVESQYFDAQISSIGIADAAGDWLATADASTQQSTGIGGGAGVLQLVLGNTDEADGSRIVDFDVERYSGCYFVRF